MIMCKYREDNKCKITQEKCPWVYWCDKIGVWKELSKMPKVCKVQATIEIPEGFNKVEFERRGYLYVRVSTPINQVVKIKNIYDYTPQYVKVYQTNKGEWKIRKIKEKNNG